MNINEQLQVLANMGGLAYAPTDDLISSLLAKTKRVRAARQSTATLVGTVGALAIGIAAAQAYSAAKDDPAFRDRNVINNKNGLTPIELYRAKFGNDNPTRAYDSGVDLSSIIAKLKAAAAAGGSYPSGASAVQPAQQTQPPQVVTKPAAPSTTAPAPAPADPYAQCKADHPDQIDKSYDCSSGQYVPKPGYFAFGNGSIYKAITWLDAATGASAMGNWSGSGNPGGWDYKAIVLEPDGSWNGQYVYMGSNATWSGSTCTGVTTSLFGTTVQASCLPDWMVDATGLIHKNSNGLSWIPLNQSLRWNACLGEFDDPSNPPAGWTWDGSSWVETPAP
jgi:hypothetical protein